MPRISFVLDQDTKNELSARAGAQGMSAYVRRILQREWGREDRYYELQASMDALATRLARDAGGGNGRPADNTATQGALFEMLLLLRALAGPTGQSAAQAEVKRVGLPVWGSSMFDGEHDDA